ncbi:isotrichodermin C-15 hydroxylase [Apodospora peruviana]|uniref:Isotrichodermin C-15 hydroxylase n=1 Tax=Apodospora peruviana TaxID=516989 RepID=A0AAE0IS13_9PEZI|nr:isotrichodermin C-15 hydroxylase [Apodospora peruviana]
MSIIDDVVGTNTSRTYLLLTGLISAFLLWRLHSIVYNLFFHPLRHIPGPVSHRASRLPYVTELLTGVQAFRTQQLHDRHGSVVRIGPSHLSFTDVRAWKDIYGHQVGLKHNAPELSKTVTFSASIDDIPRSILNADRETHSRYRRALSHGFSDASMRQQEPIVLKYVHLLAKRLREECARGNKALNAVAWYNWTTFDIVGDLVFGMSFGCLEGTDYHPWIAFIFGTVKWGSGMVALDYLGFHWLVQVVYRYGGGLKVKTMEKYVDTMLNHRLEMKSERDDLFEGLIKNREAWNLSFRDLASNAFILVLAGSETTATTLSGVTYLLLTHQDVLDKVTKEVRSAFKSADEININSAGQLTYMLAVLNEALRLFPPVTAGLVRQVPTGGANIAGHFVPAGTFVEVQHWSMNHSKENWTDPWSFKPERFIVNDDDAKPADNETTGANRLEALQAFSTGPRNCIGRNLAYAEMRLILARIIFEFDMRLADDSKQWIERQKSFVLWDRIPLNMYLTPVNFKA